LGRLLCFVSDGFVGCSSFRLLSERRARQCQCDDTDTGKKTDTAIGFEKPFHVKVSLVESVRSDEGNLKGFGAVAQRWGAV
jgi:hypothetical protein